MGRVLDVGREGNGWDGKERHEIVLESLNNIRFPQYVKFHPGKGYHNHSVHSGSTASNFDRFTNA